MATVSWIGNAANTAQVETVTITAVANGATLTATFNTKVITYTCTASDTTSTAATALEALLSDTDAPPEFGMVDFSVSGAVITCTAADPGTPFAGMTNGLVFSAAGGATLNQVATTANVSESDVNDANNWDRAGVKAIPVSGDDVVLADTDVPLLWNLDALAAVQFNSFTRYQSFTGSIGLPDINALGFVEFRPTYFQFVGTSAVSPLPMTLGLGAGQGPIRERYNVGSQWTTLNVVASGTPADQFAVRFLGTNANNTANILGASVGVAYWPGEAATLASATVDGGGSLTLGAGATFSGTLTLTAGAATVLCTVGALVLSNNSTATLATLGTQVSGAVATIATVTASGQSRVTWLSNATITTLTLTSGSVFDKSQDGRAMTITNSDIEGDTCQMLDPLSTITRTNGTTVRNFVGQGPFVFLGTKTVQIT